MDTDEITTLIDKHSPMSGAELLAILDNSKECRPEELCAAKRGLEMRGRATAPICCSPPGIVRQDSAGRVVIADIDIPFWSMGLLARQDCTCSEPDIYHLTTDWLDPVCANNGTFV